MSLGEQGDYMKDQSAPVDSGQGLASFLFCWGSGEEVCGADSAHALKQFQLASVSASAYSFVDPFLFLISFIVRRCLQYNIWLISCGSRTRSKAGVLANG